MTHKRCVIFFFSNFIFLWIFWQLINFIFLSFQIQVVCMLIVVERIYRWRKMVKISSILEMEMWSVVLLNITMILKITGGLVVLETSWMMVIIKIHVTPDLCHLQICRNYIQPLVPLPFHLLIFTIAWKMGNILCASTLQKYNLQMIRHIKALGSAYLISIFRY